MGRAGTCVRRPSLSRWTRASRAKCSGAPPTSPGSTPFCSSRPCSSTVSPESVAKSTGSGLKRWDSCRLCMCVCVCGGSGGWGGMYVCWKYQEWIEEVGLLSTLCVYVCVCVCVCVRACVEHSKRKVILFIKNLK